MAGNQRFEIAAGNQHVVPKGRRWAVRAEGSSAAGTVYKSKQEAIDAAREMARALGGNLVVHGRSGQVIHRPLTPISVDEESVRETVRSLMESQVGRSIIIKTEPAKGGVAKRVAEVISDMNESKTGKATNRSKTGKATEG